MITAAIAIGMTITLLIGLYTAQHRAQKNDELVVSPSKKAILTNEEYVKQLEQSMGIGIDIVGLPGYTWEINQGPKSLKVCLMDEKLVAVGAAVIPFVEEKNEWIHATRVSGYYQEGRLNHTLIRHSVEDIDKLVQKKMKELSKKEIDNNAFHKGLSTIVEKYNGKAVTQDS